MFQVCRVDTPAFFLRLGSYWLSFPAEDCTCERAGGTAAVYYSPVIVSSPHAWAESLIAL